MTKLHRTADSQHSSTGRTDTGHRPKASRSNQARLQGLDLGPEAQVCRPDWGMSLAAQVEQGPTEEELQVAALEEQMRDCIEGGFEFDDKSGECREPARPVRPQDEQCREPLAAPSRRLGPRRGPTLSADRSPRSRGRPAAGGEWVKDGVVGCVKGAAQSVIRNGSSVVPQMAARNALKGCALGGAKAIMDGQLRRRRRE